MQIDAYTGGAIAAAAVHGDPVNQLTHDPETTTATGVGAGRVLLYGLAPVEAATGVAHLDVEAGTGIGHHMNGGSAMLLRIGDQFVDGERQIVGTIAEPGTLREVVHRRSHGGDLRGVGADGRLDVVRVRNHDTPTIRRTPGIALHLVTGNTGW